MLCSIQRGGAACAAPPLLYLNALLVIGMDAAVYHSPGFTVSPPDPPCKTRPLRKPALRRSPEGDFVFSLFPIRPCRTAAHLQQHQPHLALHRRNGPYTAHLLSPRILAAGSPSALTQAGTQGCHSANQNDFRPVSNPFLSFLLHLLYSIPIQSHAGLVRSRSWPRCSKSARLQTWQMRRRSRCRPPA